MKRQLMFCESDECNSGWVGCHGQCASMATIMCQSYFYDSLLISFFIGSKLGTTRNLKL